MGPPTMGRSKPSSLVTSKKGCVEEKKSGLRADTMMRSKRSRHTMSPGRYRSKAYSIMACVYAHSELVMSRSFLPACRWSSNVKGTSGSSSTKRSGSAMISVFKIPSTWVSSNDVRITS